MKILRKGEGFTLGELLVVIGVITMMVVLLLPAINSARKNVRRAERGAKTATAAVKYETEFSGEKVLTISAAEYCESADRKLSDYRMVGVQSTWSFYNFQEHIPAGTEVIVSFMHSREDYAGTALIPKER